MRPYHAIGWLLASPLPLIATAARALETPETFRASDPAAEALLEESRALESSPGPFADPSLQSSRDSWLSLGAFWRRTAFARDDLGLMLTIALPLERPLFRRSTPRSEPARPATESAGSLAEKPAVVDDTSKGAAPAVVVPIRVSPRLARSCVLAAWRAQGWQTDDDLDRLVARMRWSALLPEVRVRAARGWDESFRLTPTDGDPYRTQQATGTSGWLEGRLTWRLDRTLFADEELQVERARVQRTEVRARLTGRVLAALFDWQRAIAAAADPTATTQEHVTAVLARAEAEATLDVLTGGWFGKWLEKSGE